MIELTHGDARLILDPEVGNIPLWEVTGRQPLHVAPWRDEEPVQSNPDIPMVNKRLAGDFFCLPFGKDDLQGDPMHGLTANTPWALRDQGTSHAHLRLEAQVRGAVVDKEVQLTDQVLYQTHRITGGVGAVTMAHHPMSHMAIGGRLSFSEKRAAITDPQPQHPGRNLWALNHVQPDLILPCENGQNWDLHDYPAGHAIEDFVTLVEARGARLGWTVLMRDAEDDMLVVLKDPRVLPITMLWISNGGRDFSPWLGRHRGVIGIEDGLAAGGVLSRAKAQNRLNAMGLQTVIELGPSHVIRHAMVSLPRPPGWSRITDITIAAGALTLTEAGGDTVSVPFDGEFFPP